MDPKPIVLDEEQRGDEQTANDNVIETHLVTGSPVEVLGGAIVNMSETIQVTVTNEVVNPPVGWTVSVDPVESVLPAGDWAPITLNYEAPLGATATVIEVVSTEAETGFTQNNLYFLTIPIPSVSNWGIATAALLVLAGGTIAIRRFRRRAEAG